MTRKGFIKKTWLSEKNLKAMNEVAAMDKKWTV